MHLISCWSAGLKRARLCSLERIKQECVGAGAERFPQACMYFHVHVWLHGHCSCFCMHGRGRAGCSAFAWAGPDLDWGRAAFAWARPDLAQAASQCGDPTRERGCAEVFSSSSSQGLRLLLSSLLTTFCSVNNTVFTSCSPKVSTFTLFYFNVCARALIAELLAALLIRQDLCVRAGSSCGTEPSTKTSRLVSSLYPPFSLSVFFTFLFI